MLVIAAGNSQTSSFYPDLFLKNAKHLTLSWRRSLLYRKQSIDLQSKSIDWFLYMLWSTVMKKFSEGITDNSGHLGEASTRKMIGKILI